jgi:hypothetical protein
MRFRFIRRRAKPTAADDLALCCGRVGIHDEAPTRAFAELFKATWESISAVYRDLSSACD